MSRYWHIAFTIALAQGLSACAQQGGAAAVQPSDAALLTAYHWRLQRVFDATGALQPDAPSARGGQAPQLTFSEDRVSVSGLCNMLGGGYRLAGARISITQLAGTMRMCPDASLMAYEQKVAAQLPKASGWELLDAPARPDAAASPLLKLSFADGSQWRLAGAPTDETRYGSAGETLFMEVAPDLVPCNHPLIADMQCLRVRTVHYDAAGVRQGYGDWQVFHGNIDGYRHAPGVRNVLRVKRYTLASPPADASRYAYALDMVVETEQVPAAR